MLINVAGISRIFSESGKIAVYSGHLQIVLPNFADIAWKLEIRKFGDEKPNLGNLEFGQLKV